MKHVTEVRVGSHTELPLQASKWLDLQLLIDPLEMEDLLHDLDGISIFKVGTVCKRDEGELSKEEFLDIYTSYIDHLKAGKLPPEKDYQSYFSSVFTTETKGHVYQILVGDDRRILRVEKPVLQLHNNQITYSSADETFRAGVFGKDAILWGLQFSFPQLFLDPLTKEVFSVKQSEQFPNTALYKKVQQWVRRQTIPTPFEVAGKKMNVPIRLGKQCLSWINKHPQLSGLHVREQTVTN